MLEKKVIVKEKIILFYESEKNPELLQEFQKVEELVLSKVPEKLKKYYIFAEYDLTYNSKHGLKIDMEDLPYIRYYRRQEHLRNKYHERYLTTDYTLLLNAVTDYTDIDIIED